MLCNAERYQTRITEKLLYRAFLVGKIKLVFRCAPAKPDVERKTGHEYYKHVQTYVPEVGATDQE